MVIEYKKMDNFYHYPRKGRLENFEVTEKIDGSNFRWINVSSTEIWFGSHHQFPIAKLNYNSITEEIEYVEDSKATLGNWNMGDFTTFEKYMNYVINISIGNTLPHDYKNLLYFGETVGKSHRIKYNTENKPIVLGFAVYDLENKLWRKDWVNLHGMMGIRAVPIYDFDGKTPFEVAEYITKNQNIIKSSYDNESNIEGVVMVDYDNQVFYKHKTDKFLSTPNPKLKVSKWDTFVDKYATEQRIEKILLKMKNGELGYNPSNPIPSLIGHVSHDVMEEADRSDINKILRKALLPLFSIAVTTKSSLMAKTLELVKPVEEDFTIRTLECDICNISDNITMSKSELLSRVKQTDFGIGMYEIQHNDHTRAIYFDDEGKYLGDTVEYPCCIVDDK